MKTLKKAALTAMALCMALSTTVVGYAADTTDVTMQDDGTAKGNTAVVVTVAPTRIQATLPVNGLQLTIDENGIDNWTNGAIISNSPFPLEVKAVGVASAALSQEEIDAGYNKDGVPTLVADAFHNDWKNLNVSETKSSMAISVNNQNISTAGTGDAALLLGEIESAYGETADGTYEAVPQTLGLEGSALHGYAFSNNSNMLLKWDMTVMLSMK